MKLFVNEHEPKHSTPVYRAQASEASSVCGIAFEGLVTCSRDCESEASSVCGIASRVWVPAAKINDSSI